MRPIRLQSLTTTRDRAIETDVLARLGLVFTFVGRQVYALNDDDSRRIRVEAIESLAAEGKDTPRAIEVEDRAEQLLSRLVTDGLHRAGVEAIRRPSIAVELFAQELRAEADRILAAHGIEIRARTAQAIAEHEAA